MNISLSLTSFYNIVLSDKNGIHIQSVISKSAWEPISVSNLFCGKAALVATLAERKSTMLIKSATLSRSLGNRGLPLARYYGSWSAMVSALFASPSSERREVLRTSKAPTPQANCWPASSLTSSLTRYTPCGVDQPTCDLKLVSACFVNSMKLW